MDNIIILFYNLKTRILQYLSNAIYNVQSRIHDIVQWMIWYSRYVYDIIQNIPVFCITIVVEK